MKGVGSGLRVFPGGLGTPSGERITARYTPAQGDRSAPKRDRSLRGEGFVGSWVHCDTAGRLSGRVCSEGLVLNGAGCAWVKASPGALWREETVLRVRGSTRGLHRHLASPPACEPSFWPAYLAVQTPGPRPRLPPPSSQSTRALQPLPVLFWALPSSAVFHWFRLCPNF